jgi:hypothetical protein
MTFNSVFEIAFSLDHHKWDGSDLTGVDFRVAVRSRLTELLTDDDWWNALEGPFDTYEKKEV